METPKRSDRLFHLKPFSLSHHQSSMPVGTDAILLGLFDIPASCSNVLEIGTGNGIISLLVADRCNGLIDAIDIDADSVDEARANFDRSPFHPRLRAIKADFNFYAKSCLQRYDLIITNPPFFINDLRSADTVKKTARHGDFLNYGQICEGSAVLLTQAGKLNLVLPYAESRIFLQTAMHHGLYLQKQQLIFPRRGLQPNRVNMQLGFEKQVTPGIDKFIIREESGRFTGQYIQYLKDYYIALK